MCRPWKFIADIHACDSHNHLFIVLFIWLVCRANGVHVQIVVTNHFRLFPLFCWTRAVCVCVCVCVVFKLIVWLDVALANVSNKSLDFYLMCLECTRTCVAVHGTAEDVNVEKSERRENIRAFVVNQHECHRIKSMKPLKYIVFIIVVLS